MSDAHDKIKEAMGHFDSAFDHIKKMNSVLSSGPQSYYLKQVASMCKALMTYSKFKEGDAVSLIKKPDLSKATGWMHSKHFLIPGNKAIVHNVDWNYRNNCFDYDIVFDSESWIDREGNINKVDDEHKHTYCFLEEKLRAYDSEKDSESFLMELLDND